jgi:hypothetical protein
VTIKHAARTAALLAIPTPAKPETAKEAPGGWDPYEVWRTRVLVPRLDARLMPGVDPVQHAIASTKR